MPKGTKKNRRTKDEVKAAADRDEARAQGKDVKATPSGPLDPPETKGRGRPTDFSPEFTQQAEQLCALGATDEEIADFFGVDVRTIYRWKLKHEDFCQAIKSGKNLPDDRVERSLYQRSVGTYVVEQQAIKVKVGPNEEKIEIVDVQKYVPPDTTAMIFWLKNRRSTDWRDMKQHEVGGPGAFSQMTDDELMAERERVKEQLLAAGLASGSDTIN